MSTTIQKKKQLINCTFYSPKDKEDDGIVLDMVKSIVVAISPHTADQK